MCVGEERGALGLFEAGYWALSEPRQGGLRSNSGAVLVGGRFVGFDGVRSRFQWRLGAGIAGAVGGFLGALGIAGAIVGGVAGALSKHECDCVQLASGIRRPGLELDFPD